LGFLFAYRGRSSSFFFNPGNKRQTGEAVLPFPARKSAFGGRGTTTLLPSGLGVYVFTPYGGGRTRGKRTAVQKGK